MKVNERGGIHGHGLKFLQAGGDGGWEKAPRFFPKGTARNFAYKFAFKPYKDIFVDRPTIVILYTET
jgi:hypothetical protein